MVPLLHAGAARARSLHARTHRLPPVRREAPAVGRMGEVCVRGGWYVQVGAFADRTRVTRLRSQLRRDGLRSCVASRRLRGLEVVFVGPFTRRSAGVRAQMKLRKLLNNNNYLRHVLRP